MKYVENRNTIEMKMYYDINRMLFGAYAMGINNT